MEDAVTWAGEREASEVVVEAYLLASAVELPPLDELVGARIDVRDLRSDLAQLERDLDARIVSAMGRDRKAVIEGVGQVEVKWSKRRTQWDTDRLVGAVVARVVDDPAVSYDPETGEILPLPVIAENVARGLRECVSISGGKVTGMKALGLDPATFCEEASAVPSVMLPRKEV